MAQPKSAKSLEFWPIAKLKPYDKNARTHSETQVAQVAESIKQFGFTNPVLAAKDGTIIAGHGRVMAAQSLGLKEVPVLVLGHLTEAQRRAYVLADNKLALNAGWDEKLLAEELKALDAMDFDLGVLGFSDEELSDLGIDDESEGGGGGDEDEVPEVPINPVSIRGDIWHLGKHRLMCGDSLSMDDVGALMGEDLAALVVTDPPYNVDYEGRTKKKLVIENDKMEGDKFHDFLCNAFTSMFEVMEDGAPIYVFHADMEGVNFRSAFLRVGFKLSQICIWAKQAMVMGHNDYHWQHEPVLYGWKPTGSHKWHGDRKQTTLWKFDRPFKNDVHPTMKPIDLIEYPIVNSSVKGAVVLDLFGGSGSTLIACEKTGRAARLMELDPKYVDVIVKRWEEFTGNKAKHDNGKTFAQIEKSR